MENPLLQINIETLSWSKQKALFACGRQNTKPDPIFCDLLPMFPMASATPLGPVNMFHKTYTGH